MDKLRAIQYFNRTVETGNFTAAARSLDVSTPAVTHLVGALERSLGIVLFHRSNRGLVLTTAGERYYESARRIATDLEELELRFTADGSSARGTLTVGLAPQLGQQCLMPRIGRFLERYPNVDLVTKPVRLIEELAAEDVDLAVLIGWPSERRLIVRQLAQTRFLVCATPDYWTREGWPREPADLVHHNSLLFRSPSGTVLDRWSFERDGEQRVVNVRGRLINGARDWNIAAACAGTGVVRIADLTSMPYLVSGQLVPALTDWESLESPPVFAAYRPTARRSRLVRAFLDFAAEELGELERARKPGPMTHTTHVAHPGWFRRSHGRASDFAGRKRAR